MYHGQKFSHTYCSFCRPITAVTELSTYHDYCMGRDHSVDLFNSTEASIKMHITARSSGFPSVIGVIDCTRIEIEAPREDDQFDYRKKMFYFKSIPK